MFDSIGRKIWAGIKLCFGAVLVVLGVLAVIGSVFGGASKGLARFAHLETAGVTANGAVIDIERRENKTTRRGDAARHAMGTETYDYYVEFEFKPAAGPAIKEKRRILAGNPASLKVGDQIEVLHHPEEPKVNRLTHYSQPYRQHDPSTTLTLSFGLLGLGAVIIWWNWPLGTAAVATQSGRAPCTVAPDGERRSPEPRPSRQSAAAASRRPASVRPPRTAQGFGARSRA